MTTDWAEFQRLVCDGYERGTDRADLLAQALKLVRDRPFCGVAGSEYAWAEHDIQEMVSAIVDAAHVLGRSLLERGDHRGALSAATRGLMAEPCSEQLYDDAIEAAREHGDTMQADRLAARLRAISEELDPDYVN